MLRADSDQDRCELDANLPLLVRRKDRHDAVDALRRVQRVQRREDEVACLGGEERGLDRLQVSHLTDQDHVRILAQGRTQRVGE